MALYLVHIKKEAFKFSSGHMTVFPDGSKESLHGHNYTVEMSAEIKKAPLEKLIPFAVFKEALAALCGAWNERVLLPQACPFVQLKATNAHETEFVLCGKRYVLPAEDVVWLPADNITAESLAEIFCANLLQRLDAVRNSGDLFSLTVRIEESPGQGASFTWHCPMD